MDTTACKPPAALHDEELDPDAYLDDPALQDCCRRDLLAQKRAAELKEKLINFDRVDERSRVSQHAFAGPTTTAGDEEPDDLDAELAQLRLQRMRELQAQQRAAQQQAGAGTLRTLEALELVREVEHQECSCVCHLAVDGYEPGQQLDEHLEVLAHRYRGTWFARVPVSRKAPLLAQLGVQSAPALLVFKKGAVVGRATLDAFGAPHGLLEEEVTAYLHRLKALQEQDASSDADDATSDNDEATWKEAPCEVCGRTYPHEHVKAVYAGGQPDEDSDFSD